MPGLAAGKAKEPHRLRGFLRIYIPTLALRALRELFLESFLEHVHHAAPARVACGKRVITLGLEAFEVARRLPFLRLVRDQEREAECGRFARTRATGKPLRVAMHSHR